MRNRRFHRTSGRTQREQTLWERFSLPITGPAATVAVSSPQFNDANILDDRWTLRTIRMQLTYRYEASIRVPNAVHTAFFGLAIGNPGFSFDPQNPQRADMLDIWAIEAQLPPGDLAVIPAIPSVLTQRAVKVSRKMHADDFLFWSMTQNRLGVPTDVGPVFFGYCQFSLLWSRTRK